MATILKVDISKLVEWSAAKDRVIKAAAQRAGIDAIRAMRAEATRHIRARKNMKVSAIRKRIALVKPSSREHLQWIVRASGESVPIGAFGGLRQIGVGRRKLRKRKDGVRRGGVMVEINKGAPKLIPGAFLATMKSGHKGVFRRERRKSRLPIKELFTTTVADAFRDSIDAVAAKGKAVFTMAFRRNMRERTGPTTEARGVWLPDDSGE